MAKKSYFELLKDPRWQRRRLEILQRSDFSCENCESADKTLHVHHKLYRKGAMPWDYSDDELQALCEDCHAAEHVIREELAEVMAKMPPYDLDRLLGYAHGMMLLTGDFAPVKCRNFEHGTGLSDSASAIPGDAVYEFLGRLDGEGRISGLELSEVYTSRRDARAKQ
jgi:hypothetical protein